MSVKSVLKKLNLTPSREDLLYLKSETKAFAALLQKYVRLQKIDADVFVGGSFAKGTLVKSSDYDIDILVRFDWKYEHLSKELWSVLDSISKEIKLPVTLSHGSRDYFRIQKWKLVFEVIPVVRIRKVKEARNVTDLSYFHVNYVRRRANSVIREQILLAKQFCKAQGVYGAETYIGGFSGYGLECLIIYYKTFENMLRVLSRFGKRVVVDPARHYNKEDAVLFELNENKLQSPIILVDPTWKERNVLAALSRRTFDEFQNKAREFLKNPSEKFFQARRFRERDMRHLAAKKKAEFVSIVLETNRQRGDIAGTKMKKFSRFLISELCRYFEVLASEFVYGGEQCSNLYLIAKSKGDVERMGPPLNRKDDTKKFKALHRDTYVKNETLHARISIDFSAQEFLERFKKEEKVKIEEMGITQMRVV